MFFLLRIKKTIMNTILPMVKGTVSGGSLHVEMINPYTKIKLRSSIRIDLFR